MNVGRAARATGLDRSGIARTTWVALAGCLVLAVFVLWTAAPVMNPTPSRDSSVFLYVGQRLLEGDLPYTDVWDHKPPVVFLLNAAGLALGGGSFWGVWLVEVVSLTLAAFLAFKLLRENLGPLPAAVAVVSGLLSMAFILKRGNFTEEYALPLQLAGIYCFLRVAASRRLTWYSLWMGVSLGTTFLLKQNLIGVWIVIAVYLGLQGLFGRDGAALLNLLVMFFGAALVGGLVAGGFALAGALPALWDAALVYNFAYSNIPDALRLAGLARLLGLFAFKSPFFLLALPVWVLGGLVLVLYDRRLLESVRRRWTAVMLLILSLLYTVVFPVFRSQTSLLWGWPVWLRYLLAGLPYAGILLAAGHFIGLWERLVFAPLSRFRNPLAEKTFFPLLRFTWMLLPVELLLLAYSGRAYSHYGMVLIPVLLILSGFGAAAVVGWAARFGPRSRLAAGAIALIVLGGFGFVETVRLMRPYHDIQRTLAIEYVRSHTAEDDPVLAWGAETVINLMTGRPSPTRFVYQYPLYTRGYTQPALFEELVADLEKNPPKLIIDTVNGYTPFIDQPNQVVYSDVYEIHPAGLDLVFDFVRANYRIIEDDLGIQEWVVYELLPGSVQSNSSK